MQWLKRFQRAQVYVLTCCVVVLTSVRAHGQEPTAYGSGHVSVRAVRVASPIAIDGRLDEQPYSMVAPVGGFIQQEPHEGEPATERTDIWIFFDDKNLYIVARCWDSHPERMIYTDRRRDGGNISAADHLSVMLDTFRDKRNGYYFQTNPAGVMRDAAVIDEKPNTDWNTVWAVKSGRFENGWTVEMAIPFKSLRYSGTGPQVWGILVRRLVKWKNETSYITAIPAAYGPQGVFKVASAATLVGLEMPGQSTNLEVKPYAVGSVTTDRAAAVPFRNKPKGSAGIDFKYGLTRGLTADVTVNTDFAQIEEDVQQVNLTRFSLFFPEKRDFFLEGQGIFLFGNPQVNGNAVTPGDVPLLFFSRRIGLSQGQSVPVLAGARVTGRVGSASIGVLNIQTDDTPAAVAVSTNFTVARIKLDVLRRSSVGAIVTNRSPTMGGIGANRALGADASLAFFTALNVHGFYALTQTPGATEGRSSYRGMFEYDGDRYGLVGEHVTVGSHFSPEIGYVQRTDFGRTSLQARFSPRLRDSTVVRKLTWQGDVGYITDASRTTVQNRAATGTFQVAFQNSDEFGMTYKHEYELLPRDFAIASGVIVPVGGYVDDTARVFYVLGQQRKISGRLSATAGSFYGGTRRGTSYTGRFAPMPMFAVEPGISLNWVDLPFGRFHVTQLTSRVSVAPSPQLLVSSLIQFNASARSLSSSVRLHWEYRSGSDLYVVYSDGRDTATPGFPELVNRSLAVKVTRLVRF